MSKTTVIYYSSNRESWDFESKIIGCLLKHIGTTPLIAVTQRDVGILGGIVVGDVGHSYSNAFRQLQIGAQAATTPFVTFAESDFLYPPAYFTFIPPTGDIPWRNDNVWLLMHRHPGFKPKLVSEGATVIGRRFLLESLDRILKNRPQWTLDPVPMLFWHRTFKTFHTDDPCVTMKTPNGTWKISGWIKERPAETELPLWGKARDMKIEFGLR